jgi:hypothetical protein
MSQVTEIYAKQLIPLLKLNLEQVGKPVPGPDALKAIAISIVSDLEAKNVPLKASSLMYAAFYYANNVAPAAAADPASFAAVGTHLEKQSDALVIADLVPIARAAVAAKHGDATTLDVRAVEVASKLAAHLKTLV